MVFDSPKYHLMINWQNTRLEELPIELLHKIQRGEATLPTLTKFSNHTQAVERFIKMVTDASTTVNVVGVDARDGCNRSKIEGNFLLSKHRKNYLCKEPHPNVRVDLEWVGLNSTCSHLLG